MTSQRAPGGIGVVLPDALDDHRVVLLAQGCDSVGQGAALAEGSIASGTAIKKLEEFVKFTQEIGN